MTVLERERATRGDWQRVELCVLFGLSLYWPLVLLSFVPKESSWSLPAIITALIVVMVLRKQRGLELTPWA